MSRQTAESSGGQAAEWLGLVQAPLAKKEAGEEGKIVAPVAQGRKNEADGGEMAGEVKAKGSVGGEAAQRLRSSHDKLAGSGKGEAAHTLMGDALEEVAEKALLVRGKFVDSGEVDKAAGGVFPEGLGRVEEVGGESRGKRAGRGGAKSMQSLRGQELAGS